MRTTKPTWSVSPAFLVVLILLAFNAHAQPKDSIAHYSSIVKSHIYKDYKKMYCGGGGALIYPFLTPGSNQYANVLWDWDSWL